MRRWAVLRERPLFLSSEHRNMRPRTELCSHRSFPSSGRRNMRQQVGPLSQPRCLVPDCMSMRAILALFLELTVANTGAAATEATNPTATIREKNRILV